MISSALNFFKIAVSAYRAWSEKGGIGRCGEPGFKTVRNK